MNLKSINYLSFTLISYIKKAIRLLKINFVIALIISTQYLIFNINQVEAKDLGDIRTKIAKGYSSKFCNSIGIGLSTESALKITINENSNPKYNPSLWLDLLFNKKDYMTVIDQDLLSDEIYKTIIDSCGAAINISEEKDMNYIKNSFKDLKINKN